MNSTLQEKLDALSFNYLEYDEKKFEEEKELFEDIENYAKSHHLENTLLALYIVRGILLGKPKNYPFALQSDKVSCLIHFRHCLNVTEMLIHLSLNLDYDSEDIVLASTVIHVLPEVFDYGYFLEKKFKQYGLDPRIYDIVQINYRNHSWNEEEKGYYYERIERNPHALIVKLADRSNVLEQMYNASITQVQNYVRDTKKYFYPMCIYGKEHYSQMYHLFAILMEKMKSLVDVADILSMKHINRMDGFNTELLILKEDNARLKRMIRELKEDALEPGK